MATQEQLELRKKWIEALRSGKYKKGRSWLRLNDRFCCLGVACDVLNPNAWSPKDEDGNQAYLGENEILPPPVIEAFGLRGSKGERMHWGGDHRTLTSLNDNVGYTFAQIADFLEQHPEQVFID